MKGGEESGVRQLQRATNLDPQPSTDFSRAGPVRATLAHLEDKLLARVSGSAALFIQCWQLGCEMHNPGQMQILQQRGQPRLTQTMLSEPASLTNVLVMP